MLSRRKPSLIKLSNELRQIPDRDRTWAAKAFADAINGQTGGDDKGLVFYGVAFGVGASGQRPLFGVAQKPLTLALLCAVGVDAAYWSHLRFVSEEGDVKENVCIWVGAPCSNDNLSLA